MNPDVNNESARDIAQQKYSLIEKVEVRLRQDLNKETLFTVQLKLV